MHGSAQELESYKRELILQYLIPAFGSLVSFYEQKIEDIVSCCHLQSVMRLQRLETPGKALMGFLWFSIDAMSHSYFYDHEKQKASGTMIYKRRQFIFNSDSLLYSLDRSDYVQILEPGEVLYIGYQDLLSLMSKYADINQVIRTLAEKQSTYLRQHMALLQIKSLERVRRFRAENEAFLECSSQEIQAIHVNLGLRNYIYMINKLK